MQSASNWPWIASLILLFITIYLNKGRFVRRIENVVSARGFGDDNEEVTLVLADGTTIKTTWGAIKKRVKGDHEYLLSTRKDWVIGGIYCVISIAVPLAIGYLFHWQASG
jgi:hypothetical protein